MNLLRKLAVATVGVASITLGAGVTAQAVTFTETTDAGETLSTAQIVNSQPPRTPVESISGSVSRNTADLFQIFLTGGQTFSATTVGGADFDTQLFLFNVDGFGVEANDDAPSSTESTLPLGGFSPTTSGIYYLGISGFDYDPVSSGGFIFPNDIEEVVGPTGSGGRSPLIGFGGDSTGAEGNYTITLTGVQSSNAAAVPFELAPGLGSLSLGVCGAIAYFKQNTQKRKGSAKKFPKN